jgi:hypothetical protein
MFRIWDSLLRSIHVITHWLISYLGSRHLIYIGRDRILGLRYGSFLLKDNIIQLNKKRITILAQASVTRDPITFSETWISSKDLVLSGTPTYEWEIYCNEIIGIGVSLHDINDTLLWTRGDSFGNITVKNIYYALISTQDYSIWCG